MMRRVLPVLSVTLLLLVITACAQAPGGVPEATPTPPGTPTTTPSPTLTPTPVLPQYTPEFTEAPCAFEVPLGRDVSCGYLTVPQHRDRPANGELRLHVAIVAAASPDKAPDPVLYLAGGPGEKALAGLSFTMGFLGDFAEDRDFIVFDQRGVGHSEPNLDCTELVELSYETLNVALEPEEAAQLTLDATTACHDRLVSEGVDLSAYTTAESAADVRDLRTALGYDEWNILGISYGTRLALTVLRDYPEGIRAVVLDSAYPPEVNLYEELPANFDRAIGEMIDGCEQDPACATAYPDIGDQIFTAYDRLNASPVHATITHPLTQEPFDALLDGEAFMTLLFQGMYSAEILPLLPEMILDGTQGDVEVLALLAGVALLNNEFISHGMQTSVQCAEEIPFTDVQAFREAVEQYPLVEPLFAGSELYGESLLATCAAWDVAVVEETVKLPATSSVPTLILAGQLDPVTPPAWGELAASGLDQGTFLVFPDQAHGAVGGTCARSIAMEFLRDPAQELDLACMETLTAPRYALPFQETQMVPFQDTTLGLAGMRPEGWQETGPGTYSRSMAGETVLVLQAIPFVQPSQYLELLLQQLGVDAMPDISDTRMANGLTWELYETEALGAGVDIGITAANGTTLVVLTAGLPGKQDELREYVFLPAVDALVPHG